MAEQLAVQEALATLPPRYRIPLVLYSIEGYSVAEIATMLELSAGAVKVRLYRAREKFRRAYGVPGDATSRETASATDGRRSPKGDLQEEGR